MIVKNKIHDKSFKSKLPDIYNNLEKIIYEHKIVDKQKIALYNRLNEYKIKLTSYDVSHSKSEEAENISNTPFNFESIIKYKDDRISLLESTAENLKTEIKNLKESKIEEKNDESGLDKYVAELEKESLDLKNKINSLNSNIEENELIYKNEVDKLKLMINNLEKNLNENKKTIETPQSIDLITALDNISTLSDEITNYREKILSLKKQLAVLERTNKIASDENANLKMLVDSLSNKEKIRILPDDLNLSSVEEVLKNELDSIIKAFEQTNQCNISLEAKISHLNAKQNILFDENSTLKNKMKELEDSKIAIEKEKKRLEQMKKEIINNQKLLKAKEENIDNKSTENMNKIQDYKERLSKLDLKLKQYEKEAENARATMKKQQNQLHEVLNSKNEIEFEYKKQKTAFDNFKSLYSRKDDDSLVKDLETYKKVLYCPLCDLNLRNCTLVKCMHVFCEDCINARFKARKRKCPSCEMEFSMNDVKKLYF